MSLPSQQLLMAETVLDSRLAVSVSVCYIKHHPVLRGIEPLDKELKTVTVCLVSHETLVYGIVMCSRAAYELLNCRVTVYFFLFLSFRRVLNVIYSFLGNSPASEF